MTFEVRRVIAENHAALPGHFPGHPIVPGVLILDEVLKAVQQWRGQCRLLSVVSVRFRAPLEPGNAFSIELRDDGHAHIAFECLLDGSAFASGRLAVEPDAGAP